MKHSCTSIRCSDLVTASLTDSNFTCCDCRQTIKQLLEASSARNSSNYSDTTATASAAFGAATVSLGDSTPPGDTVSPSDAGRVAPGQLLTKATVEDYIRAGHDERVVQRWRAQLMQWAQVGWLIGIWGQGSGFNQLYTCWA